MYSHGEVICILQALRVQLTKVEETGLVKAEKAVGKKPVVTVIS
tara:strand:+ start:142 stop:273 length:132 start_codon:yes stop_codon:yes gene_type:complete